MYLLGGINKEKTYKLDSLYECDLSQALSILRTIDEKNEQVQVQITWKKKKIERVKKIEIIFLTFEYERVPYFSKSIVLSSNFKMTFNLIKKIANFNP